VSSRRRSMPSRCRTAAWAARHDQMVERVLVFAQSTISVNACQYVSPGERRRVRLGAGDDQSIDLQSGKIGNVGIVVGRCAISSSAPAARTAARSSGNRCGDRRRHVLQAHELSFSRLKRRVRHVVDQPDRKLDVGMLRTTEFILFPQLRRGEAGTDDQPPSFQQHVMPGPPIYSAASSRLCPEQAIASAWSISAMMSETCSMPIESRMVSGSTPAMRCCSETSGGAWSKLDGRRAISHHRYDQPRDQLQRVIEGLAGLEAALDAEGEQR